MKIQDIKTFEDACKAEGLDAEKVIGDFSFLPDKDRAAVIAITKLFIIARAVNRILNGGEEWKPDWNNYDQYKYTAWFEMGGSSGFRFVGGGGWYAVSSVGSRLSFVSREAAQYVGKQFEDLYRQFMVIE